MQTHIHFMTLICSSTAYSWPGIREEGSLPMRSSTHPEGRQLPSVQMGISGQREKQEGGSAGWETQAAISSGVRIQRHISWQREDHDFPRSPWEVVWCLCKPRSSRKLLEETARLEERLQPEKTSWQWVVAVTYLFLINLPQTVDLAFLWERFI